MSEFSKIEISMLTAIEFDLEIDIPTKYLQIFKSHYLDSLFDQMKGDKNKDPHLYKAIVEMFERFYAITHKLIRDQYLRPFCLYFPAPIILASCLLLANLFLNKTTLYYGLSAD